MIRYLHESWRPVVMDLRDDVSVPETAGQWISAFQERAAERGAHRSLSAVDLQICATADTDFVTAARFAVELSRHNVHDGPRS
ncbi:hypothetical protein ABZ896_48015 [Streptomyces sp. NPDC047072]|uniref:hypothetical protein n=1 Tax=Streptomyces sp. NPDC047072 TaxID=3154809 RepID=UPI0033C71B50